MRIFYLKHALGVEHIEEILFRPNMLSHPLFLTNSDLSFIAPMPSILQSMS